MRRPARPFRGRRLAPLLWLAAVLAALPPARADAASWTERSEWVMGTRLRVVLPEGNEALADSCFAQARRLDRLLSPWKEDSALSRVNAGAGGWVEAPPEFLTWLARARADAARLDGAYDPTVAPLLAALRRGEGVEAARRRVGAAAVEIEGGRVRLPAGFALDPGADGKGVALDAVAALLDRAGVRRAFVDFGGSTFLARGDGPEGEGWTVLLTDARRRVRGELRLRDECLSVSSTLQWVEGEDGAWTSRPHLVDPSAGAWVGAERTAAVAAASATEAEVLSTALAVRGEIDPGDASALLLPPEGPARTWGGMDRRYRARSAPPSSR